MHVRIFVELVWKLDQKLFLRTTKTESFSNLAQLRLPVDGRTERDIQECTL